MRPRLLVLIFGSSAATALLCLFAVLLFPPRVEIRLFDGAFGTYAGVVFWVLVTVATSAVQVRMPQGSVLDLSIAPLVAAMSLGGPGVAAVVALLGTTQLRELKGAVPWYGVAANRVSLTFPSVAGAFVMLAFPDRALFPVDLAATIAGASVAYFSNLLITAVFVSTRDGLRIATVVRANGGGYLTMLALVPIAWLMASIYMLAGWWAVLLFVVPLQTTRVAYQRFVEIREMFSETAGSLAMAVDSREPYTRDHSHQVQKIAMDIGREMRVSDEEMEALEWGGLLHDIGKIGIPDAVLLKQERLTREEREVMNRHAVIGAEIIAPVRRLAPELPIIRHHHEWFNGSGYPDRLAADEIPKLARIIHVADAYEAMTASRPYRMTPLTPEQALGELRKFGGIQFDPEVVDAFVRTKWAEDVPDPGRANPREIAYLAEAALSAEAAPAPA